MMRLEEFTRSRQARWQELQQAASLAAKGRFRRMPVADIERMDALYRAASSDLAIAARDFPDENVTIFLNTLCARAYALLNRGEPPRPSDIPRFFTHGLPQAFRRNLRFFWLSLAITVMSAVAGAIAVYARPDLRDVLVPQSPFDQLARGQHATLPPSSLTSGFVITNNIKVDALIIAGGILFGIGTALLLAVNGWMLGTIAAAVHQGHYDGAFWAYIVPHGAIELSVIVVSGAAGLMVGNAELRPRLRARGHALTAAAVDAMRLGLGVAALLCVAGIFEGFVSPSTTIPASVKYAIGAANFVWLYCYLAFAGRSHAERPGLNLDAAAPYS